MPNPPLILPEHKCRYTNVLQCDTCFQAVVLHLAAGMDFDADRAERNRAGWYGQEAENMGRVWIPARDARRLRDAVVHLCALRGMTQDDFVSAEPVLEPTRWFAGLGRRVYEVVGTVLGFSAAVGLALFLMLAVCA